MKKVLMIAYFFPPLGGSGVQRTLKFVKYLPQFGLLPVVSTVKSGHNFAYDEKLLQEVPESVKIYRSSSLETLWLREVLEKLTALRSRRGTSIEGGSGSGNGETPEREKTLESGNVSLKRSIFNFIDNYLFIPDSKVRWFPLGFWKSLQVAQREKVDYLFSSSYPYTVHWIALAVHTFYRKPWIADFRDPWVGNKAMQKNLPFRKKLDEWMERKVVERADAVINVTPSITEMYQKRYPKYAHKMVTITNGFDPEDFVEIKPVEQQEFTLIHTGIIAEAYDMESFAEGVKSFLERNASAQVKFRVLFIGYVPPQYEELLQRKLGKRYEFKPYMSHQKVLEFLSGAQLQFLTFDQSVDNAYSGKLFDYIGTGKPILGLLPEGVAAKLIRERQLGSVVALGDSEALTREISQYYEAWLAAKESGTASHTAEERCAEFSRVNLAGQLAGLLKASDSAHGTKG